MNFPPSLFPGARPDSASNAGGPFKIPRLSLFFLWAITAALGLAQLPLRAGEIVQTAIEFTADDFSNSSRAEKSWEIWGPSDDEDTPIWEIVRMTGINGHGFYPYRDESNEDCSATWRIVVPESMVIKEVEFFFDRVELRGTAAPDGDDHVVWDYSVNGQDWTTFADWENRPANAPEIIKRDCESVLATIKEKTHEVYIRIRKEENLITDDSGNFIIWSNAPVGGKNTTSKVAVIAEPAS